MRCYLFYYRIPKVRRGGRVTDLFPNPSPILRRIGYRVDGSVWVIPEDRLPYHLMRDMDATVGVVRNEVRFDETEAAKIAAEALAALNQQALDAVNAVQSAANEEYDPKKWATEEEFEAYRANRVRTKARLAERLLNDFGHAAEGFGLSANDLDIDSRRGHIRTINALSRHRARVYVDGVKKLREAGQPALASAAEKDMLPPGIMADVLRDAGEDDAADEIMETSSLNA